MLPFKVLEAWQLIPAAIVTALLSSFALWRIVGRAKQVYLAVIHTAIVAVFAIDLSFISDQQA